MAKTFKTAALAALIKKTGLEFSKQGHYGTGVSVSNYMSGGQWDRGYAKVQCSYGSSWWHDEDGSKRKAMADKLRPALEAWCKERGFRLEAGVATYAMGKRTITGQESNFTIYAD